MAKRRKRQREAADDEQLLQLLIKRYELLSPDEQREFLRLIDSEDNGDGDAV